MTGGLASVAGSVLAGYAMMGIPLGYLLAASFMSAPAGLIMAKILMPETEKEVETDIDLAGDSDAANVIDAAAKGAGDGMKLALNVAAMLIAFIALIALLNGILGIFGDITMEKILGYVFAPIAFAVGVPWHEAQVAGGFIGQKVVVNEFVAYSAFAPKMAELSAKTNVIVSFALCGFANFSSIAILIGGLGGLVPERRSDIARLGLRCVAAGVLASLLSAAMAGMLF
jgi:CNT family concentrative nucleoside transporter